MSSDPVSLNPTKDLGEFFEFMYGDQEGFVYAPTKDSDGAWEKNFFEWPAQRSLLVNHCLSRAPKVDVYYGPALYKSPTGRREDIKGSYVFWTEFDGNTPPVEALGNLPSPTMRVRSSEEANEHWYWRLDYFEVDTDAIERANRGLTYQLGGDTSAWDANQVLRPVSTYNHKRQKPVLTLAKNDGTVGAALFASIPVPPSVVSDVDVSAAPDALTVVAKYKWEVEAFDFFRKVDIPVGSRSSAMMRLAFYCTEMKMSDSEAFSILYNADERWGKFKGRTDRKKRLLDLINKARLKYPLEADAALATESFPVYGFNDFLNIDIKVEWVIEGILQKKGYLLMSGPPGTGKTQISLQWAMHMALGRPFLGYSAGEPLKVVFFSMEMGHADLQYFVSQMAEGYTADERAILQENLLLVPLGYGVLLDKPHEQARVESAIRDWQPQGVFFDSLGMTTTEELTNEGTVKVIMDWQARLRAEYDVFTWFLHHNRKAQSTNKKPNKLADVYGSQYITSYATTVLGLWPTADRIEVSGLKVRLTAPFSPFTVSRKDHLNFVKTDNSISFKLSEPEDSEDEDTDDEPTGNASFEL